MIFDTVIEYPIAIVLACLLRPAPTTDRPQPRTNWLDYALPIALGALVAGLMLSVTAINFKPPAAPLVVSLVYALPALLCYSFRYRPVRFGLGVGAFLLVGMFCAADWKTVLHMERSFFGVYRVVNMEDSYHALVHGTTFHGSQSLLPTRRCEPLSYFHRAGPLGQVFDAFTAQASRPTIAVIGLGTGSMGGYAKPGQQWTFYEIDPTVERLARDPRYFTYLRDCLRDVDVNVVLGDARLSLMQAPAKQYGLIAIDAFSSDAIPIHLITREALQLYLAKLADRGLIVFHISNRYLRLRPVLCDLASDAQLLCVGQEESGKDLEEDLKRSKFPSHWIVMARQSADLGGLVEDPRWQWVSGQPGRRVWTDDFSNILSVFRWR